MSAVDKHSLIVWLIGDRPAELLNCCQLAMAKDKRVSFKNNYQFGWITRCAPIFFFFTGPCQRCRSSTMGKVWGKAEPGREKPRGVFSKLIALLQHGEEIEWQRWRWTESGAKLMECTSSCDKDFLALNLETLLGTFSAGRRIRRAPPQPSLSLSISLSRSLPLYPSWLVLCKPLSFMIFQLSLVCIAKSNENVKKCSILSDCQANSICQMKFTWHGQKVCVGGWSTKPERVAIFPPGHSAQVPAGNQKCAT